MVERHTFPKITACNRSLNIVQTLRIVNIFSLAENQVFIYCSPTCAHITDQFQCYYETIPILTILLNNCLLSVVDGGNISRK